MTARRQMLLRRGVRLACGAVTVLAVLSMVAGDDLRPRGFAGDAEAIALLRDADAAAHRTSFEGVRFSTTLGDQGEVTSTIDATDPRVAGLHGFSSRMLGLLVRNYGVVRGGDEVVHGRPARLVEARRRDGSTAGRFWFDRATGLLLRRVLTDRTGRAVDVRGFREVTIGPPAVDTAVPDAPAAPAVRVPPVAPAPGPAELGVDLPDRLPGGMEIYAARRPETMPDGPAVHVGYSDGLSVVSVFVQPGELDEHRFTGWRRTSEDGQVVYHRDSPHRWAVWAADGHVYTLLTDAPPGTADRVVTALPHGDSGLWGRLDRGFSRLRSWADPFT